MSAFICLGLEAARLRLTMLAAPSSCVAVEKKGLLVGAAFAIGLAFGSFYLFDTLLRGRYRGPLGIYVNYP